MHSMRLWQVTFVLSMKVTAATAVVHAMPHDEQKTPEFPKQFIIEFAKPVIELANSRSVRVPAMRAALRQGRKSKALPARTYKRLRRAVNTGVQSKQREIVAIVGGGELQPIGRGMVFAGAVLSQGALSTPQFADAVGRLRKHGYSVWEDRTVRASLSSSVTSVGAPAVWNLVDSQRRQVRGTGIKIGIIDTGIDYRHPDLGGCAAFVGCSKVAGGYDFVNRDTDPMDDQGHGTHVAAIAAGNGTLRGVAPAATLYAYKVLDADGRGDFSNVIAAIDRSVDPNGDGNPADHLHVVNLSLGADSGSPDDPVAHAVDRAFEAGVVAVVAAGNAGTDESIGTPGLARNAVTVGAFDHRTSLVTSFSSRGPVRWSKPDGKEYYLSKPDLVAPGEGICAARASAWSGDTELNCLDSRHVKISGTSMASPHVAGMAALLRQKNPSWPPARVKQALINTAVALPEPPAIGGAGSVSGAAAWQPTGLPVITMPDFAPAIVNGTIPFTVYVSTNTTGPVQVVLDASMPVIEGEPPQWFELERRTITSGTFTYTRSVNALTLRDGTHMLRLRVIRGDGVTSARYAHLPIQKLAFTSPEPNDLVNPNEPLRIDTSVASGLLSSQVTLEYKEGHFHSSATWKGISGSLIPAGSLATGYYTIRARLAQSGIVDAQMLTIFADRTLKRGWPVRVPTDCPVDRDNQGACEFGGGPRPVPLTVDLDGNGAKEVLVASGHNPLRLRAFRADGSPVFNIAVDETREFNVHYSARLTSGYSQLHQKTIIFALSNDWYGSSLHAFLPDGRSVPGWPVALPDMHDGHVAIADINADGTNRVVVYTGGKPAETIPTRVLVFRLDGTLQSGWDVPVRNRTIDATGLAVANLDGDAALEIVVSGGQDLVPPSETTPANPYSYTGALFAYEANGAPLSGWPRLTNGWPRSGLLVADLDRNGSYEIVTATTGGYNDSCSVENTLSCQKVYVFDARGNVRPGFPITTGESRFVVSPVAADFDRSFPGLELLFCPSADPMYRFLGACGAIRSNGTWSPARMFTPEGAVSGAIAGDITGDGVPELLVASGEVGALPIFGARPLHMSPDGGVFAWTSTGALVSGFPKPLESGLTNMSPTIGDVDGDGYIDLVAASADIGHKTLSTYKSKRRNAIYMWQLDARTPAGFAWPEEGGSRHHIYWSR